MVPRLSLCLLPLSFVILAARAPEEVAPARDLAALEGVTLLTLDGREVPFAPEVAGSVAVLAYTGVGCPISGKYAGRLTELAERFRSRGVRFVGVNASPQDSRAAIAREREELGLGIPVFKDHRQALTRRLGARTTTEVFVFDARGAVRFHGAVDDQYAVGAAKPEPTRTWLVDALEALLAGREPAVTEAEPAGCLLTLVPEAELPEAVTWSRDVARILQKNCESCHRPGQAGPFSLQTYEEARGWAEMIGAVVEEGRMPPWNALPDYRGVFANERRLGERDKALLLRWIADGMPRGLPAEDPPPLDWPEGWRIGEPDAVFTVDTVFEENAEPDQQGNGGVPLPEQGFEVPREGVVEYVFFTAQTSFPEDRWIQAIETRAGAPDVVHHVLILLVDPSGEHSTYTRSRLDFTSYLAAAVPGETSYVYPPGYGKRLPAGSKLVFQIHYTPNGKQRFDRSSVAMIFCDEPPELEVITDAVFEWGLNIPPGAENHEVRAKRRLFEDTAVVAFLPHMHTRGKDFRYMAHYPDGSSRELLAVDYDFNWQESYVLPEPLPLPPDTVLEVVGHFDNSAANPANPDPTTWVGWGDQTFEEMFIGYFDRVQLVE